eukprot:TRINITY_DN9115_c0_g1_i1.p1 TRINITY_DN9115_c0_g1~~TRINITY_DN9115_c0_g1_i1.p1  ORF type:complete len:511 (-),score=37.08 TRINITY_DN9115_c0_g1_i1:79-1611(-)
MRDGVVYVFRAACAYTLRCACIILVSWVLFVLFACNWSGHETRSVCLVVGPLSNLPSHLRPIKATLSSSIPRLELDPNLTGSSLKITLPSLLPPMKATLSSSMPPLELSPNLTGSSLKIQKDERQHTLFVNVSTSSQITKDSPSVTPAASALTHFAMFPRGTWKKSSDKYSALPLYDPMKCTRRYNKSCWFDLPKKVFERFLGSWSWKGSGLVSKAVEEYKMLDRSRLHAIVKNRKFIFVGDSLAGQDHLSFQLLMLCHGGGTDACVDAHNRLLLHLPSLGASIQRFNSPFLPIGNNVKVAAAKESYWINEQGKKVKMRAQPSSHLIDLDKKLFLIDDFKRSASLQNAVIVFNFGRWFASVRSDVRFKRNGQSFKSNPSRLAILTEITRFVAHYLNATLAAGSLVIWRGYSPGVRDADQCHRKQMHQVTQAIYSAVEPYLGPRQLFIDTGCAFRGPEKIYTRDGNHFMLPGPPDLGHLFTFRILNELLPRGAVETAQSSELQCATECKAV